MNLQLTYLGILWTEQAFQMKAQSIAHLTIGQQIRVFNFLCDGELLEISFHNRFCRYCSIAFVVWVSWINLIR